MIVQKETIVNVNNNCTFAPKEFPLPLSDKRGWPWTESCHELSDPMSNGSPWPRVTIVTPSYNQGQFIEETIRSVLLQNYPNLEYIIIDGGSSDNSVEIIKKYSSYLTYWISEPDRGQSHAINKGWKMATGEIVAYLNSDDTYCPNAISTAVNYLDTHQDISMIYGDCLFINEESENIHLSPIEEFDFQRLVFCNFIPQPAVFFRKNVINEIGFLDESLHMAMDYDLWVRIGLKYNVKYLAKTLANFRMHKSNKSQVGPDLMSSCADILKIQNKLFNRTDLPDEVKRLKNKAYYHIYRRIIRINYQDGEVWKGRVNQFKSFLRYPPQLLWSIQFYKGKIVDLKNNFMKKLQQF